MAESADKAALSAEEAYAAAAVVAKPAKPEPAKAEAAPAASDKPAVTESAPAKVPVAARTEAPKPAPVRKPAATKAKAKPTKTKPAAKKPVAKAKPAKTIARTKSRPKRVTVVKTSPAAGTAPKPTITELKEKIMAAAKTTDFTKPVTEAMSEIQTRAKAAYAKSTEAATEMTEFTKGNVEALVESGKVLGGGLKTIGKTYVEEAKSAYETMSADMKEMASIKSPTELFQLQGKLARRNFDSMVAYSTKTGDTMMKLYTDAFAPISSRVSLAAEKISKAA